MSLYHNVTLLSLFFFFNDTATTEIYTLSLHDALPIYPCELIANAPSSGPTVKPRLNAAMFSALAADSNIPSVAYATDRKSTRLNSSHANISYAVFCLKKKK